MGEYFCYYSCMDCGRVVSGPVNESEPKGWGYDDDECEYVCPEHTGRLLPEQIAT